MVWGEDAPVKPGFPIWEVFVAVCLVGLAAYLVTDPIGRSAAASYEDAVNEMIGAAAQAEPLATRTVMSNEVLNKLPSVAVAGTKEEYAPVNFSDYVGVVQPTMTVQDIEIRPPTVSLVEADTPVVVKQPAVELDDLGKLTQTFIETRDDSLLSSEECSRSSNLSKLCGKSDFGAIEFE